jgi:hypothetical protein
MNKEELLKKWSFLTGSLPKAKKLNLSKFIESTSLVNPPLYRNVAVSFATRLFIDSACQYGTDNLTEVIAAYFPVDMNEQMNTSVEAITLFRNQVTDYLVMNPIDKVFALKFEEYADTIVAKIIYCEPKRLNTD